MTFVASLRVTDRDAYGRLGGNALSGRIVVLRRRLTGTGDAWQAFGMDAGSNAGTYRLTLNPSASYDYQATFAAPVGEGLHKAASQVVVTVHVAPGLRPAAVFNGGRSHEASCCAHPPGKDIIGNAGLSGILVLAVAACSAAAVPAVSPRTAGAETTGSRPAPATVAPAAASAGPPGTPIASPSETHPAGPIPGLPPAVRLNGPFGSVDGEPASSGEARHGGSRPLALDTYVASAPLSITLVDPDLTFAAWSVSAEPVDASEGPHLLEVRPYPESRPELLRVTGPAAGDWLLRADLTATGRAGAGYVWRLAVPDRQPPGDGHLTIPVPRALVRARNVTLRTVPGSGCYVEQCSDTGGPPPGSRRARADGNARRAADHQPR